VQHIVKPVVRLIQQGHLMAPTVIPKKVEIIKEEELPPDVGATGVTGGVVGGIPGGSEGGVLGGIIGSAGSAPPPPPKAATQRIRVGGNVQSAKIINEVQPTYPEIAKTAHIQGTVVLHAIIGKDGTVRELQFISGPPLLMRSAMDAVRQWRYQPTLLNGADQHDQHDDAVGVEHSTQAPRRAIVLTIQRRRATTELRKSEQRQRVRQRGCGVRAIVAHPAFVPLQDKARVKSYADGDEKSEADLTPHHEPRARVVVSLNSDHSPASRPWK
jgi:TonB family protein